MGEFAQRERVFINELTERGQRGTAGTREWRERDFFITELNEFKRIILGWAMGTRFN